MKKIILLAGVGLALAGCSGRDRSSALPNANDTGTAAAENSTIAPNAGTGPSTTTAPAGPSTGVGAGAAASSGIGTASASGASANESRSAEQKGVPPAGTGAQQPNVNSNGVGNAGNSTPQNNGSTR